MKERDHLNNPPFWERVIAWTIYWGIPELTHIAAIQVGLNNKNAVLATAYAHEIAAIRSDFTDPEAANRHYEESRRLLDSIK